MSANPDENSTTDSSFPKDAVEAIFKLANAMWRDFDSRRSYEWKVTFGLWTALGLFAAGVIKGDVKLPLGCGGFIVLVIIFGGIWLSYTLLWTPGLRKRQKLNLDSAHYYWNGVEKIVTRNQQEDMTLDNSPRFNYSSDDTLLHWSHCSQIITTTLLMFLDFWCVWTKRG